MSQVVNPPKSVRQSLTILHLYPDEMNIYGDRGNILALSQRLRWRGFGVEVIEAGIGQEADIAGADIIFGGGGQDSGQLNVGRDLSRHQSALLQARDKGVPILAICGTYQLLGHGFSTVEGEQIPGIGLFDLQTQGSHLRMIGNVVIETEYGELVGFENHSGRTILGKTQKPFGKVKRGYGNDGKTGLEGARTKNAFGTYLHGPILPKNPSFTDALILAALKNKFNITKLEPLDDSLEKAAAETATRRPQ